MFININDARKNTAAWNKQYILNMNARIPQTMTLFLTSLKFLGEL